MRILFSGLSCMIIDVTGFLVRFERCFTSFCCSVTSFLKDLSSVPR